MQHFRQLGSNCLSGPHHSSPRPDSLMPWKFTDVNSEITQNTEQAHNTFPGNTQIPTWNA